MATKQELKQEADLKEKIKVELKVFGCQWDLIGDNSPEGIAEESAAVIIKIIKKLGYKLLTRGNYKLPLTKCQNCKVKEHCLKFQPKRCPNELED